MLKYRLRFLSYPPGGASGSLDASNMFKPSLARGDIHCIGATTLDEFRKYVEKDAALARRFQPVMVQEPTVEELALQRKSYWKKQAYGPSLICSGGTEKI